MKLFLVATGLWIWITSLIGCAAARGGASATASFEREFSTVQRDILLDVLRQAGDAAFKKVNEEHEQGQQKRRKLLPNTPCNSLVSRVTTQELLALVDTVLSGFISDNSTLTQAKQFLLSRVKYEIQVWKICGSCESALSLLVSKTTALISTAGDGALSTYCNSGVHGYNATHSSLVFVPEMQQNRIQPGQLRTYLHMHSSAFDISRAPTAIWPGNITVFLASTTMATSGNATLTAFATAFTFIDFLAPLAFSSFGGVSIIPDYIGYGESAMFDRAYGILYLYRQAAGVAYIHTQEWLKNLTTGCSVMEEVASTGGLSEGGLASIAGATALKGLGVRILSVYSGTPPLDPSMQITYIIKKYDAQDISSSQDASYLLPLAAGFATATYSYEFPNVANTGTGQKMVSTAWDVDGNLSHNVPLWFAAPNPINLSQVYAFVPEYLPDIINDNLRALFQQAIAMNITDPCASSMANTTGSSGTDMICKALADNSASRIIETADFPVILCYSTNDTVISPDQFVPTWFTTNLYVTRYSGFAGVPVEGDHGAATASCALSPIVNFILQQTTSDSPTKISNLTNSSLLAACGAGPIAPNGTNPPMPTMKPTSANKSPTKSPKSGAPELVFTRLRMSSSLAVFLAMATPASLLGWAGGVLLF